MVRKTKFEKLFEPLQAGLIKCRNRIVSAPHGLHYAKDGHATVKDDVFYEAVARGGSGMVVVGPSRTESYSVGAEIAHGIMCLHDDKFIPALARVTQIIHKYDSLAILQLSHPGPTQRKATTGSQPVAASTINRDELPFPPSALAKYEPARSLTIVEIEELVNGYAKAAERAKRAGFNGVEVHAGHSYLLNSFLSRFWNRREDAYGGSLENRARFPADIIRAIKSYVGRDFIVGVRMNGKEWGTSSGITSEESQGISKIFEGAGADYISVTGYGFGRYRFGFTPEQALYPEPSKENLPLAQRIKWPGAFITEAEAIKKIVSVPVIGVGRLDPELGELLLREGKVDMVAFARRFMADPELPNKVASGRLEDIRPCMADNECATRANRNEPIKCRANAALGEEQDYEIKPAEKKWKVLVVGGGPAGMEAARVAALRGHKVILCERQHKLGGLLPLAAFVKGLEIEDLPAFVHYFEIQLAKLGVEVKLGKKVNLALVEDIKPDVVILAPGGIPAIPDIPGINGRNVLRTPELHRMLKTYLRFFGPKVLRWLTTFWMPFGRRVVVIGGGAQGCELAEFLVKRGRKVTIVETSDEAGTGMTWPNRENFLTWFAEKGNTVLTGVRYEEITSKGLTITTKEGERKTIEADTVVPAMPLQPDNRLFKVLEGKVPDVRLIGDAREPHLILEAIHDGYRAGLET